MENSKFVCERCGTPLRIEVELIGTFIFPILPDGTEDTRKGYLAHDATECLIPSNGGEPIAYCTKCHQSSNKYGVRRNQSSFFEVYER